MASEWHQDPTTVGATLKKSTTPVGGTYSITPSFAATLYSFIQGSKNSLFWEKKKDQLYNVLLIKNTNGDRPDQTTPSDSINKLGLVFNTLKSYRISDTSKRYESKF